MFKRLFGMLFLASFPALGATTPYPIKLPKGFQIEVFADRLPGVRFMTLSPGGELMVSRPSAGEILLFRGRKPLVFAEGLNRPHGLAWHQGSLYVANTGSVVKLTPNKDGSKVLSKSTVTGDIPAGGMHWTRTIGFGPDGGMFVSVGSDCNACVESDPRRAAILRFRPDGQDRQIYGKGLRNAVGFAWHPETKELWATENGRDELGDDLPPDELNLVREGGDYGWPSCYGKKIPDPSLKAPAHCARTIPSALDFQAHSAALGIAFYTGKQFPSEYKNDAFVAFHGSWNRTVPTGYKVVRVRFENGKPVRYEDFATGWWRNGAAWGRPVDVLVSPDGSLFVSDDKGGRIYRIFHRE
ncbi:MAG TPA: sorbosone dehydrogenase [Cyanobacteria bacterium UBA8530]|nr:sorbosone dehydrogenase [Cyanobacteria bacterium UBA8530]